jgi:hypothetical protein
MLLKMFTLHYNKFKKKMKRAGLHVLLLFCMFALRKDERKLQYSSSNILGFINTGYFRSDNVPDRIKNATHNTFLRDCTLCACLPRLFPRR